MPRKPSVIMDAKDVYESFKGISRYKRERVYAVLLEGDEGNVLGVEEVSRGSDGFVDAYPLTRFSAQPWKSIAGP